MGLAGDDQAHHCVGVADDVLGARVDHDVDPVLDGIEVKRRRPGVVAQHHQARLVRRLGDGGHVLNLEAEGAGRFDIDQARVRPDELGDPGADQRVVVAGLDPEALEQVIAHLARRIVHRIGHQDVVADAGEGQEGAREPRPAREGTAMLP